VADTAYTGTPLHQLEIDTTVPHSARVWNYWLGGKDNFAVDRQIGEAVRQLFPGVVDAARQSRAFLGRVVRFLASEAGVREFLDIGTGLPTVDNTHEVAQRVAPESRVAYVDNDPMVLAHARVLLVGSAQGATCSVNADLHNPEAIVRGAKEVLDFTRPVAVMLLGILGHVADDDEAYSVARRVLDHVPSGSYLVVADGTDTSEAAVEAQRQYNDTGAAPYHLRSPARIARFFDGLELLEPGVVPLTHWRPDPASGPPVPVDGYCGVARKP
jgi:hypothetical protein